MEATKHLGKIDSVVLANYILKHYGAMSHLKLQKLLFYCDAYCLAYFGEELVTDQFEALVHGPVSKKVYNSLRDKSILYSDVGYSDIGVDVDAEFGKLTFEQQEILASVLGELSKWSGPELENATHHEAPWIIARGSCGEADICHNTISKSLTKKFYAKEQGR
ncbi:MAG: DUF4065 domain-containing protein [Prevotella sp.]|nr:DUF4065 domain-containing protein [Prevotella sp.]